MSNLGRSAKNSLGENLKAFREACGCTQQEAADYLGLLQEQICCFEKGQEVPSAPQLLQLCDLYGVDLEEFYQESFAGSGKATVFKLHRESFNPEDWKTWYLSEKLSKTILK
jgi:transcriptional regulator with XRE-family HTH domain